MLSTFFSALSYFTLIELALLTCFLKKDTNLLSSSSISKFLSSVTTFPKSSPISPKSLVFTESKVFSEKLAIFF